MLSKLALRNVKRQVGNYLIYFMTVAFTVAMLFSVNNIIFGENLQQVVATNQDAKNLLMAAVILISMIVAFVLSYATSFLLKLRKREFGTYLTLGMTRRDILTIFLSETAIICMLALGVGLGIGLFFYQGLAALMMRLMEMEFTLAAYAPRGLALTVGLVAGIFLLASLISSKYLGRVSIYQLMHGEMRRRKVRYPALGSLAALLSFVLILGSLFFLDRETARAIRNREPLEGIVEAVLVLSVSIIFFHMGLGRSLIHFLLGRKRLCSRGTNAFVLRSLSGALGSNSAMLGILAFLLTFAVFGVNASFIQKAGQEEELAREYPYDVRCEEKMYSYSEASLAQAEKIMQKYAGIVNHHSYILYTAGGNSFYERTKWSGWGMEDYFMKLSDFNALILPLGYGKVELENECLLIFRHPDSQLEKWEGFVYTHAGKAYALRAVCSDYPRFSDQYFYVVVPDEAAEDMAPGVHCAVYDLENGAFNAAALLEELKSAAPREEWEEEWAMSDDRVFVPSEYTLREYGRQDLNSTNAILVIGSLFAAMVFLFMAMAILALKVLSGLAEDKRRYGILFCLGVREREQGRTLFYQTFGFFLFPFVVPLLMSIPTALLCRRFTESSGMASLTRQIPVIAAATAAVMTLAYLLYYIIAYRIARHTVIRNCL